MASDSEDEKHINRANSKVERQRKLSLKRRGIPPRILHFKIRGWFDQILDDSTPINEKIR